MRSLVFEGDVYDAYEELQREEPRTYKALVRLIQEIRRNPTAGRGRPERLRHQSGELWSRRIDRKNRIVYSYDENRVYIYSVRGHYGDS